MLSLLKSLTENKSVAILGFGREGRSTYKTLVKSGSNADITILDKFDFEDKKDFPVSIITGENYMDNLSRFDLIFKSPGVVISPDVPREKITSQTEIFLRKYKNQVVGITGTKGKSTTTTLIHHILKEKRGNAVLVGNIGIPAFDRIDEINENSVIVYELSCHQLEFASVSPHIAILLNLFPEHLDHYGSIENYYNAKRNIYLYQDKNDMLFVMKRYQPYRIKSQIISVSDMGADITFSRDTLTSKGEKTPIKRSEFSLIGDHNLYNISVAYGVCRTLGISPDDIISAVKTYKSLPHRLEVFLEKDGIRYIDDSISTACETTAQGVMALGDVGVLILGGMDRGIDYAPLIEFLRAQKVPNVICMYDSGKRIFNEAKEIEGTNLVLVSDLKEACDMAKKLVKSGSSCLLSPASASYGNFKN
ncbi:MAG: UDP-N-acetylmuramoyl-L-alanine--D-glutamate ligase, partial [Oscillospiraceae bacterium]|nr:UDP-N-acetylmuramoyl-L-alanine--D-glutamate ligase [Oscillospiraceae bacterium]